MNNQDIKTKLKNFKVEKVIPFFARALSVLWIVIFLFLIVIYSPLISLTAGILSWTIFVLITVISWKEDPFGGALFFIFGAVAMVIIMALHLDPTFFLFVGPFFILGTLFLSGRWYEQKQEQKGVDDF